MYICSYGPHNVSQKSVKWFIYFIASRYFTPNVTSLYDKKIKMANECFFLNSTPILSIVLKMLLIAICLLRNTKMGSLTNSEGQDKMLHYPADNKKSMQIFSSCTRDKCIRTFTCK